MKRRVIEKLKLSEISGVDRPCQEHARVTIMKRAPGPAPIKKPVAKMAKASTVSTIAVQDQADAALMKFWSVAARLAAIAARQHLAGAISAVRLAATRGPLNAFGLAARQQARRRVARTAAGIGAVGAASHYYTRRDLLEERDKKRKSK